ncbi:MAG: dihydropteroate synthase [Gammaproteobacteria bacterium]
MKFTIPNAPSELPLIMGILNVTPDSFSDGGRFNKCEVAIDEAAAMVEAGVDIIDVGGESTRPGAEAVTVEQELARVIPVIEAIRTRFDTAISIDTMKPEVMTAATQIGASMINDVNALEAEGALKAAALARVPVCVMHKLGSAKTMQNDPNYVNVVDEVAAYLKQRIAACVAAGIPEDEVVIDPGFGFGKKVDHNLQLFSELPALCNSQPVLVGVSRKSMLGAVLNRDVHERLSGSLALAALATWMGAAIVRVHDVPETIDAVRITRAVRDVGYSKAQ